jgi:hypothetical protein
MIRYFGAKGRHRCMNPRTALLLQIAIVLLGSAVLVFLLWEPHLEGRNAHATPFEVYFHDPFLAYVYVGSIPFFAALYQAFQLLGQVHKTGTFSQDSIDRLRVIKFCALAMIGFVAGGVVWILLTGDPDDRPAGLFMCLLVTVGASVIAIGAAMFARGLQKGLKVSDSSK